MFKDPVYLMDDKPGEKPTKRKKKKNMTMMSYEDLEKDQQEILEKSDINTLANYCQELRTYVKMRSKNLNNK